MKNSCVWFLAGSVLMGLLGGAIPASAQEAPNRLVFRWQGMYGTDEMDWEKKRIRITAIGTYDPEEIAIEGDKMILAQEQATLLAREKLVAMNYGVWVTGLQSVTTRFTDSEARLVTAGILRDAQVEKVEFKEMSDRSLLAVVTMTAPMLKPGDLLKDPQQWQHMQSYVLDELGKIKQEVGHQDLPTGSAAPVQVTKVRQNLSGEQEGIETEMQQKVEQMIREDGADLKSGPEPAKIEGGYTGLIVNVKDVPNARVTMLPRIIDETDRRIYGIEDVPSLATLNTELVQYASSMDNARRLPQAGSNPLEVRALKVDPYNPGHMVVSRSDGAQILGADAVGQFLSRASVVLVF